VLVAITPAANFVEPAIFTVADTAGGSALAPFRDANAVQCEKFVPRSGKVDFLFVVDDSCSMAGFCNAGPRCVERWPPAADSVDFLSEGSGIVMTLVAGWDMGVLECYAPCLWISNAIRCRP